MFDPRRDPKSQAGLRGADPVSTLGLSGTVLLAALQVREAQAGPAHDPDP